VKKLLQIASTILLLALTLSTSSFGDGGNPYPPDCPPGQSCAK